MSRAADQPLDLGTAAIRIESVVAAVRTGPATSPGHPGTHATEDGDDPARPDRVLDAIALLHRLRADLDAIEPVLIEAARAAGVSWQALAGALGVASRQAAERRYLRLVPATTSQTGTTRDGRVQAERDRRAGSRAVTRWANDNTADLRRLAGQITALHDLADGSAADVDRLHEALADPDASALPELLTRARRHLGGHPVLAGQVDAVTERTDRVRRDTQQERDDAAR